MPIKKFKNQYRPQRQGIIHLGVKKIKSTDQGAIEYPHEVNYFVLKDCPELVKIYGPDPEDLENPDDLHKELYITLPSARFDKDFDSYLEKVAPQYYKRYRQSGLYCKGDGEAAVGIDVKTKQMEEIKCPCDYLDSGDCKQIMIFRFRIQEIASFNIYQITTSSTNSILNINSFIRDLLEHCLVHRIDPSSVKLSLRRELQTVQRMDEGKPRKSKHWIMVLDLDRRAYKSIDDVAVKALPAGEEKLAELPPPDEKKDERYFPESEAKKVMEEESEKRGDEGSKVAEPLPTDVEQSGKPAKEEEAIVGKGAFEKARDTLLGRMEDYVKKWGGEISLETAENVAKFKKFEEVSKELDRINAAIEEKKKKVKEKKQEEKKKRYAGSEGEIPF